MLQFKIVKTKAILNMQVWKYKDTKDASGNITEREIVNKAIMEIAPSIANAPKGPPKKGEKRYDYDKKIKISFNPTDMLKVSFKLQCMANGEITDYKKFGDLSKQDATKEGKKSLAISSMQGDQGNYMITATMSEEGNRVSIQLDRDEAYAWSRWFECTYNKLYLDNDNYQEEV